MSTTSPRGYFQVEVVAPGFRAVRLLKPDVARELGRCCKPLTESEPYLDMQDSVLPGLAPGETIVLNFRAMLPGLSSAFYSFLLYLRRLVLQHQGRLVLCHLHSSTNGFMEAVHARRIFTIVDTERDALTAPP